MPSKARLIVALLLLFTTIGLSFSCGNKWGKRLSEKEIEAILGELYVAQNIYINDPSPSTDTLLISLRRSIFRKYQITESDFDSVITYYAHYKSDRLSAIAQKAADRITADLEDYQKKAAPPTFEENLKYQIPKSLDAYELADLIPIEQYPSTILLSDGVDALFYSTLVRNTLYKTTTITIQITLYGLPNKIEKKDCPLLEVSCIDTNGNFVKAQTTLSSNGTKDLCLYFDKDIKNGQFSILLHSGNNPHICPIFVTELSVRPQLASPPSNKENEEND